MVFPRRPIGSSSSDVGISPRNTDANESHRPDWGLCCADHESPPGEARRPKRIDESPPSAAPQQHLAAVRRCGRIPVVGVTFDRMSVVGHHGLLTLGDTNNIGIVPDNQITHGSKASGPRRHPFDIPVHHGQRVHLFHSPKSDGIRANHILPPQRSRRRSPSLTAKGR